MSTVGGSESFRGDVWVGGGGSRVPVVVCE